MESYEIDELWTMAELNLTGKNLLRSSSRCRRAWWSTAYIEQKCKKSWQYDKILNALPISGEFYNRTTKKKSDFTQPHFLFWWNLVYRVLLCPEVDGAIDRPERSTVFEIKPRAFLPGHIAEQSLMASGAQTAEDNSKYPYTFFDCNELCYLLAISDFQKILKINFWWHHTFFLFFLPTYHAH